jgi:nitrate reductase assembly molybdenum cofactor insertion protein NarJ
METPLTERTQAIMEKLEHIEARIEKLQDVTDSVRQIQKTLEIRESRWNAFVRSLKHFLSLTGQKLP